jgi:hypothetical protein
MVVIQINSTEVLRISSNTRDFINISISFSMDKQDERASCLKRDATIRPLVEEQPGTPGNFPGLFKVAREKNLFSPAQISGQNEFPRLVQGSQGKESFFPGSNFRQCISREEFFVFEKSKNLFEKSLDSRTPEPSYDFKST